MGLGSTAKKLQTVADSAEQLYGKVNDVREQVEGMRETVAATEERVERLEVELAEQRALVVALAEAQGIDPESVVEGVDAAVATPGASGHADADAGASGDTDDPAGAEASR